MGDVVVGSLVKCRYPAGLRSFGGEHDDRRVSPPAQLPTDLDPVYVGEGTGAEALTEVTTRVPSWVILDLGRYLDLRGQVRHRLTTEGSDAAAGHLIDPAPS